MLDKASLFLTGLVMTLGGLWYAADQFLDAPRAGEDRVVVADISEPHPPVPFAEAVKASVTSAAKEAARDAIEDAVAEARPVLTAKAHEKPVAENKSVAARAVEVKDAESRAKETMAAETVEAKAAKPTSIDDILDRLN